jgi:hypothetical protein
MDLRKKVGETSLNIGTRERWILEKKVGETSLNIGTRERWILEKKWEKNH